MDCVEFSGIAAEMALGVLTGRERADALAHAERCDGCREMVRQLAMTGEELVGLLPAAEPPPGFETRVMARIGAASSGQPQRWHRSRRVLAAAAVALAVLGAGLGGWSLRGPAARPASSPPASALTSAALVSAGHRTVGEIYYHAGARPWMYMSVELRSGDGTVTCQLEGPGEVYTTAGSFRLIGGYGAWGSPAPWGSGPVTGARLLGPGGTVLATARF